VPRRLVLCVLVAALVAAACGGGGTKKKALPQGTTTSESTTTTTAPPLFPLTGAPAPDPNAANRPALTIKIENISTARPQSGLDRADLVYEEIVEGGITRFVAIFQSHDADPVGSIRSLRPTDPELVRPIHGLFAYSGGTPKFKNLLHSTPGIVDVGYDTSPGAYFERREKPSDHRLFSSTPRLYGAARGQGQAAPKLFTWLAPGQPISGAGAVPVSHVDFQIGDDHDAYDWDPAIGGWKRSINGLPHRVEAGFQLSPTNVILQFTPYVISPGDFDVVGSPVSVANLIGTGDAWVLTGGMLVKGKWSKPSDDSPTTYTDVAGAPIALTPGGTWVELTAAGAPASTR